jgi:hypothetical protein
MAQCKKCKADIVPLEVKAAMNKSYFVCPVCKHGISDFSLKGLLIFICGAILLWAVLFIHHHMTN